MQGEIGAVGVRAREGDIYLLPLEERECPERALLSFIETI